MTLYNIERNSHWLQLFLSHSKHMFLTPRGVIFAIRVHDFKGRLVLTINKYQDLWSIKYHNKKVFGKCRSLYGLFFYLLLIVPCCLSQFIIMNILNNILKRRLTSEPKIKSNPRSQCSNCKTQALDRMASVSSTVFVLILTTKNHHLIKRNV